jgi:hypothetical protein
VSSLTSNRQIPAVPETPIRAHVKVALDIHGYISPQIPFHLVSLINDLSYFDYVIVRKIIAFQIERDTRFIQNIPRCAASYSIDIGESDFYSFIFRQIDACNTCHVLTPFGISDNETLILNDASGCNVDRDDSAELNPQLSLSLFVFGVDTQNAHHPMTPNHFAFGTNFLHRCSDFHDVSRS